MPEALPEPIKPAVESSETIVLASTIKDKDRWWTTEAQLKRFEESVSKIFIRKNTASDDMVFYRIVSICPEFKGIGEELQDVFRDSDGQYIMADKRTRETGYPYLVRFLVEPFREHATEYEHEDGVKRKKRIVNPGHSFRPYAWDFLSKHDPWME